MYVQDYDESFPMSAYLNGTCVATFYWAVAPYVKNDQITVCPSENMALKIADAVGFPCPNTPPTTGYSVNPSIMVNGFFPGVTPTALAAIARPSDSFMEFDGNVAFGPGNSQAQIVQARHAETFNVNYVDGHSKNVKATRTGVNRQQFTVAGPGKNLPEWRIGANGGLYANRTEGCGLPQDDNTLNKTGCTQP